MPRVTLSYRRDDSAAITRLLFERLTQRYGRESVFMDIDAIELGEDFRERIDRALRQTDYLLVMIGSRWLGPLPDGGTRIMEPDDPVRMEVERALELGIPIVPVLLDQTKMPGAGELPAALDKLTYLNAAVVSAGREFDSQLERIVGFLERTRATPRHNLPLQVTSFVGREAEVAKITALLEQHRLVTLVGSGGVGKTRTSLQVAANAVDRSDDGVWFIELAPLASGDYVPATIAQILGVTLGDGDPLAQLVAALTSKRMLLVFDNCEHLVEATARVVAALITGCPQITIVASSRQALGITGEATFRMPSLPVPVAVALFVERAQAVNDRFELTDEDAPIVADICRRLDGVALAIELAAARVKMLRPAQLRARLDERFRVLTGGGRDRLPRQQTLRALIDWSHDLLDAREQMLFRRLGIFVNGFTLEAAVAVGGGDDLDEFEVFDLVASLTEKSLVMAEPQGSAIRYSLLESTRAYAVEKLVEAGERDRIAGRHLRYFRDWFTQVQRDADEFRVNRTIAFSSELDNLRFALDGAETRGELMDGAELLAAIGYTWTTGGLSGEGIARLEACIAALPSTASLVSAKLRTALFGLYIHRGHEQKAREAGEALVHGARAAGNGPVLAEALRHVANMCIIHGDFAAADAMLTEAETITGVSALIQTNLLIGRGNLSMDTGDLDTASRLFLRLRDQFRSRGRLRNVALSQIALAEIAFLREQYRHAADLWREAVVLVRHENDPGMLLNSLVGLGSVLAVCGDLEAASAATIDALTIGAPQGFEYTAAPIELRAYIVAVQGDVERSARLAGYADACFTRIGYVRTAMEKAIYDRLVPLMQQRLAPDVLARLTAEGAALTTDAAIALAREEPAQPA
jgi:predicted ATPase